MVADADGGRHRWWWMWMVDIGMWVCWHVDTDGGGCRWWVDVDETWMSVNKKENLLDGMDTDGGGCRCVTANMDVVVHGCRWTQIS